MAHDLGESCTGIGALELNDDIVQRLSSARMALELGEEGHAVAAIEAALGATRRIVSRLLEEHDARRVAPGDLVRRRSASDGDAALD